MRFLVVGTGFGEQHARWLNDSGLATVAAVGFQGDRSRAASLAERYGTKVVTDDPLAVIAGGAVDAVAVVNPPGAHEELCAAGLAAGLLVVCDKPLAVDARAARRMADLARAHPGRAAVTFQWRAHSALRRVRERCAAGELGTVVHVDLEFHHDFLAGPSTAWPWRHSRSLAGAGALSDLGIHLLDLMQWLVPGRWQVEAARASVVWPIRETAVGGVLAETEDVAEVWLAERGSSRSSRIFASRASVGRRAIRVLVQGSTGTAAVDLSPDDGSGHVRFQGAGGLQDELFGPVTMNPYSSILGADGVAADFEDGMYAQELLAAALTAANSHSL